MHQLRTFQAGSLAAALLLLLGAQALAVKPQGLGSGSAKTADISPIDLAGLSDASYEVRLAAVERVRQSGSISLSAIERAMARPDLPLEARIRLMPLARAKFEEQPRGALGVEFDLSPSRTLIRRVLPNFPAGKVLVPGDEIISVDGRLIADQPADFGLGNAGNMGLRWGAAPVRPHIIGREPGEIVKMKVVRWGQQALARQPQQGGFIVNNRGEIVPAQPAPQPKDAAGLLAQPETIELEVPLGRFSDLANTQPIQPVEIADAWRLRIAAIADAGGEPEVIGSGVAASAFGEPLLADSARAQHMTQRVRAGHVLPLAAGGTPAADAVPDEVAESALRQARGAQLGEVPRIRFNAGFANGAGAEPMIRLVIGPDGVRQIEQMPAGAMDAQDRAAGRVGAGTAERGLRDRLVALMRTADAISSEVEAQEQAGRQFAEELGRNAEQGQEVAPGKRDAQLAREERGERMLKVNTSRLRDLLTEIDIVRKELAGLRAK